MTVKVVRDGEELLEECVAMVFSKNYTLLGVELSKKRLKYRYDTKVI